MKILIPFSGGINSTYSLYRWLTETDAEVVARYADEEFENTEYNLEQSNRLKEIVLFLDLSGSSQDKSMKLCKSKKFNVGNL